MGSYISGRKKQGVKSRGTGSLYVAEFSSFCLWSVNLFLNIAVQFNLFPKGSQNFKKHKTLRHRTLCFCAKKSHEKGIFALVFI